jgi:NAD(P)-dependent dehydrogenase (short-subunit alcohol dehydrogenase family)
MSARTAIVTGGTRGIGRAIAAAILREGGRVMIAGRDNARVRSAVQELSGAAQDRVAGLAVDVRDPAAVEALMHETARRFGGFDTLVNNAGIGHSADVASTAVEDWNDVLATNLSGPFYCSRAALPWLRTSGGGWIISIASLAATRPFAAGAAYCASKAGLIAFSEALMQEVRHEKIRVSVVLPGSVATGFSRRPAEAGETHDVSWKLSPDDVAQAVMDLLRYPARSLPSRVEIRPARPRT